MKVTHTVDEINFEWDAKKAETNKEKHNIDFEEAAEVFFDPFVRVVDVRETEDEAREAAVGMTKKSR